MAGVADQSFEQRLSQVFELTAQKVGPEIARQLRALVEPKALAITAGVLLAWVLSHGIAIGEIVDIVIGVVGVFAIGMAVFSGLDELFQFARGTYRAQSDADLDAAAEHLATAISILGIQAVLAVLFRGRPITRREAAGPPPPPTGGRRYSPSTLVDPALGAGRAYCSWWGDIYVNAISTGSERAMLIFHEQVHQFLTPKLYLLRNFRVEMRIGSYAGSSLFRWLEEWLAYTVGYGRIGDWKSMFGSFMFPVERGYVYWVKAGSNPRLAVWGGSGIIPEAASLIATGSMIGVPMHLYLKQGAAPSPPPSGTIPRMPALAQ